MVELFSEVESTLKYPTGIMVQSYTFQIDKGIRTGFSTKLSEIQKLSTGKPGTKKKG